MIASCPEEVIDAEDESSGYAERSTRLSSIAEGLAPERRLDDGWSPAGDMSSWRRSLPRRPRYSRHAKPPAADRPTRWCRVTRRFAASRGDGGSYPPAI
jgi:hypothetical protein